MQRNISVARYTILNNKEGVVEFLKDNGVDISNVLNSKANESQKIEMIESYLKNVLNSPEKMIAFMAIHPDRKAIVESAKQEIAMAEKDVKNVSSEILDESVKIKDKTVNFYEQNKELIKGAAYTLGGLFAIKFILGSIK